MLDGALHEVSSLVPLRDAMSRSTAAGAAEAPADVAQAVRRPDHDVRGAGGSGRGRFRRPPAQAPRLAREPQRVTT